MTFEECKSLFPTMATSELQAFRNDRVNDLKSRNYADFELGVRQGWWEDWNKKEPIPNPTFCDFEGLVQLGVKFMSQLVVRFGCFDSVSEARKAGWIQPLKRGEFIIKYNKFQRLRLIIE